VRYRDPEQHRDATSRRRIRRRVIDVDVLAVRRACLGGLCYARPWTQCCFASHPTQRRPARRGRTALGPPPALASYYSPPGNCRGHGAITSGGSLRTPATSLEHNVAYGKTRDLKAIRGSARLASAAGHRLRAFLRRVLPRPGGLRAFGHSLRSPCCGGGHRTGGRCPPPVLHPVEGPKARYPMVRKSGNHPVA